MSKSKEVVDALQRIAEHAKTFFSEAIEEYPERGMTNGKASPWQQLSEETKRLSLSVQSELAEIAEQYVAVLQDSVLYDEVDVRSVRLSLRSLASALQLRRFEYSRSYVASDEDRVLGVMPAEYSERVSWPYEAQSEFNRNFARLEERLRLVSDTKPAHKVIPASVSPKTQYRPNTAFIMMQIDDSVPRLEDVKNVIKSTFTKFGIKAVRSDEIEHQGVITERILDEIATSEFLVADLSGERPSVYYEVGYAHALNKRPILYREKGTKLHFDLSVHNVPEYTNITDLQAKLERRLIEMTNRNPSRD